MLALAGRGVQLDSQEAAAKLEISRAFESAGLRVPAASEVLASLSLDRARAEKLRESLRDKSHVQIAQSIKDYWMAQD